MLDSQQLELQIFVCLSYVAPLENIKGKSSSARNKELTLRVEIATLWLREITGFDTHLRINILISKYVSY